MAIRRAGAQHDFYGSPDEGGRAPLDDEITDYEKTYTGFIHSLSALEPGDEVDVPEVARVLVHSVIRAKHIRALVSDLGQGLSGVLTELFSTPQILEAQLLQEDGRLHKEVETTLLSKLIHSAAWKEHDLPVRVLMRLFRRIGYERRHELIPEVLGPIQEEIGKLDLGGRVLASDTHAKALTSDMSPQKRREMLEAMSWRVEVMPDHGGVVPDCVALTVSKDSGWSSALFYNEDVVAVIFPIQHNRVLIGTSDDDFVWNYETFVEQAFRQSAEFALASSRSPTIEKFHGMLGQGYSEHLEKTLGLAREGALSEFLPTTHKRQVPVPKLDYSKIEKLSVLFEKDARSENNIEIGKALSVLVGSFQDRDELPPIHGVTFSADCFATAQSLAKEHGTEPVKPTADGSAENAVFQPVMIDGAIQTHLIFSADVGVRLISDDPTVCGSGVAVVRDTLAAVSLAYYRHSYPLAETPHVDAALRRKLSEYGFLVLDEYFRVRALEQNLRHKAELEIEALEKALVDIQVDIVEKFSSHKDGDDIDNIFLPAATHANTVGCYVARILAIVETSSEPEVHYQRLKSMFAGFGLGDWLDNFSSDLTSQYDQLPNVYSPEANPILDHLDRLLMGLGILVDAREDGTLWVYPRPQLAR